MKNRAFILACIALLALSCDTENVYEERFLASDCNDVPLFSLDRGEGASEVKRVVRGTKVEANIAKVKELDGENYYPVEEIAEGEYLYAKESSLVEKHSEVVKESPLWVRTPASIITNCKTSSIGALADKGEELDVVGFESLNSDGSVSRYKVSNGELEGYVYAKYLVRSEDEAKQRYKAEQYDRIHRAVRNSFGGGEAIGCDFYPVERCDFSHANNKMPDACYSLYLNSNSSVLGNIEKYIELAKETKINTFVIDIKDNERPGYKAQAMKDFSPTNYTYASANGEKLYKRAVKLLHEAGFYVVGRITCFKDSHFVKDHPECAITEIATGQPFKHNKAYWPSPYDRRVWQFNVALAKESVKKFGFDEINFDYVRFPDRMTRVENLIDYHNHYDESKVQAIQRFVQYACDEIHAVGAYVSIDVFGESANPGYTTAYGQYWPAISNICDAICGMPYPDHFTDGYYGVKKPWNNPYWILKAWGARVQDRQAATPTPAVVRTWIQAYPVMSHVDSKGLRYNAEDVEAEIRGLYDAGLLGGYITWHSGSKFEKYTAQKEAFCVDYLKEWQDIHNVR